MSACGCEHCACDCEECCPPRELTPEQLAAAKAQEDGRLAARMTPARNSLEQVDRDIDGAMETFGRMLSEALYRETH